MCAGSPWAEDYSEDRICRVLLSGGEGAPYKRMPWSTAQYLEMTSRIWPSFLSNNLSGDGRGRFAFAHGQRVQCTRKHFKKHGGNDFTLAMKYEGVSD